MLNYQRVKGGYPGLLSSKERPLSRSHSVFVHLIFTLLRVIPSVIDHFLIISDVSSGSKYGIYLLTLYSGILFGILSDILFWHSIWHLF